jgi:predicted 3-demethylubiquinone-9 3-methyltransferase (glyoxalase superfamily)
MQNCALVHFEQKAKEASDSYKEHITDTKKDEINYAKNILDKEYKHDLI